VVARLTISPVAGCSKARRTAYMRTVMMDVMDAQLSEGKVQ
jgi:hypothetical protein